MIGQTISHYNILAKLGQGGMGAVYRAEDQTLQREVALKFLPPGLAADAQARLRLLNEARAASRLNHPNIATIYEVNVSADPPFLAMELVTGQTLKELLQRSVLAPATLLSTAGQIAEGLQEAHRSGVYHHDIKPANIMLDSKVQSGAHSGAHSRASIKILDFGLSELVRQERNPEEPEDTFLTRTASQNVVGGTVPYMSPEKISGQPADARSDIFSFGVLLYECLTGRIPFRGETAIDILHAILREPYTPLRSLLPEIQPEWETLIDRCLAKAPSQRYSSMQEILDQLDRIAVPAAQPEKSIAVLYFANLSGEKEDEYFRDGMTEDITTELTKIDELRLLPRSAVLAFRDQPLPASQIGRQLAAAYVLDGSLRRSGNRLRITAQLAETSTGHSIWAERYDRQIEDVFAIQDEIAKNIAHALRVMLTDQQRRAIEKVPTRDIQAYDYYLRGRGVFYELRRKSLEYARQMYARAIVIDPSYAAAYAGVADCCAFLYMWFEASEDNLKEAQHASKRAVELEPDSAEAHSSRGTAESISRKFQEAEQEFQTAMRLNPKAYDTFYFYGRCVFAQGKFEQAADLFRTASELDPGDFQSLNHLEMCLRSLGRMEEARQESVKQVARVERYIQIHPKDARAFYLGAGALLQLGDRARCLEWCARALAVDPEENATLYNVACSYALMGEKDQALALLETAVNNGFGHRDWVENDPDFASLRDHPRFTEMLRQLSVRKG